MSSLLSSLSRFVRRTRSRLLRGLLAGAACVLGLALTAERAAAQGGHFTAGDLFVDTSSAFPVSGGSAIMHVDPVTHATSVFLDTTSTSTQAVFDPYRQRLLFVGATDAAHPWNFWMADGVGALEALGPPAIYSRFAPTGDGRIYMFDGNAACCSPFAWLDAANVVHTLLDDTGLHPFLVDGIPYPVTSMVYSPATNALFVASSTPCGGGPFDQPYVRKLQLSADGTRVIGPAGCATYDVFTPPVFDGAAPKELARLPDGRILIITDSNGGAPGISNFPRILQVDPLTSVITPFAFTGNYISAHVIDAGTWCESLNKVVILDSGVDNLRAWSEGEVGPGQAITPVGGPVSSGGGSAELVTLLNIPSSSCKGGWLPYGVGLAGQGGLVPTLTGGGCPQAGSVITLKVANAVGGAGGSLFIGLAKAALPFKGGTLHVAPATLTINVGLGGAAGVAGAGSLSLPALMPGGLSGLSLYLQGAFSDAAAVHKVSLTQGLQMEIG